MSIRGKDNKDRILREGESQLENGNYDYRWLDKSGRRHSVYAKTLKELRDKQEEIFKNEVDGLQVTATRVTLNDMYDIWIKIKRGIKDNTFQNYKYMYETFVMEDIGKYPLIEIKKSYIRFFYNQLVDTKGVKIRTLDSIHTVLYQVLELAVEKESIRTNPTSNALTELKRTHNIGEKKIKL